MRGGSPVTQFPLESTQDCEVASHAPRGAAERAAPLLACVAALALAVSPALVWFRVRPDEAARVGKALEQARLTSGSGAEGRHWEALAARLSESGGLTGIDLVEWSRQARQQLQSGGDAGGGEEPTAAAGRVSRAWALLGWAILGGAGLALLLMAYLVAHGLRRWRSPMLILGGVAGLVALAEALASNWLRSPVQDIVSAGAGYTLQLVGGGGLLVGCAVRVPAGAFVRVTLGVVLCSAALGVLGWAWIVEG